MTMTKTTTRNSHVAVFSFPSASHSVALFNLVLNLAHAAPYVSFSFFGTKLSNKPLLSKPNIPNNIKFYTISDGVPVGHVLGPNPVERINLFLQAGPQNLQKGINLALEKTKNRVTCIIADSFLTSSLTLAQNLCVPWVAFWPSMPLALSAHFYTDLIRQECSNNTHPHMALDFIPGFSKMRVEDLPDEVLINNDGEDDEIPFSKALASFGIVLPQAKAVIFNFFEELDLPFIVEDLRSKLNSMLYAGFLSLSIPLPPLPPSESDETGCLSWLDNQCHRSVVYVSFGTVVAPPPHEIVAVAEALEESGFPFLWSLKDHLKRLLPKGFLERTSKKGKVVHWAPQAQLLGHGAVGVFVTHCGNNSVSESISNGVPLICRPFFGDQGMIARTVQDIWEIGVKIEGGVFTKKGLMKSLNLVLMQKEGEMMRKKAQKKKGIVVDAAGPKGKAAQDFKNLVELVSS